MKTLPHHLFGLCFVRRNNAIFDVRQGILTFPYLSMQLKPESSQCVRAPSKLIRDHQYTLRLQETLAVALKMPNLLDHDATGIFTPSVGYDNHGAIVTLSNSVQSTNNSLLLQIINLSATA